MHGIRSAAAGAGGTCLLKSSCCHEGDAVDHGFTGRAVAFQLAMRAGGAAHAVASQLAMRAWGAGLAVLLQLVMRTRVADLTQELDRAMAAAAAVRARAFQLAMRAWGAGLAVLLQLAMRARVAGHAVVFHLAMRAGGASRAEAFLLPMGTSDRRLGRGRHRREIQTRAAPRRDRGRGLDTSPRLPRHRSHSPTLPPSTRASPVSGSCGTSRSRCFPRCFSASRPPRNLDVYHVS